MPLSESEEIWRINTGDQSAVIIRRPRQTIRRRATVLWSRATMPYAIMSGFTKAIDRPRHITDAQANRQFARQRLCANSITCFWLSAFYPPAELAYHPGTCYRHYFPGRLSYKWQRYIRGSPSQEADFLISPLAWVLGERDLHVKDGAVPGESSGGERRASYRDWRGRDGP